MAHVQDAYWLAGHDYHSLMVRVPVTVRRDDPPVDAYYYQVKWDSLADNVVTARDDIGWPSLWAEVGAPVRTGLDSYTINASWRGFRFFDMEVRDLRAPTTSTRDESLVQVTYKYVPVGYGPGADTSKLIVNDLAVLGKVGVGPARHDRTHPERGQCPAGHRTLRVPSSPLGGLAHAVPCREHAGRTASHRGRGR